MRSVEKPSGHQKEVSSEAAETTLRKQLDKTFQNFIANNKLNDSAVKTTIYDEEETPQLFEKEFEYVDSPSDASSYIGSHRKNETSLKVCVIVLSVENSIFFIKINKVDSRDNGEEKE